MHPRSPVPLLIIPRHWRALCLHIQLILSVPLVELDTLALDFGISIKMLALKSYKIGSLIRSRFLTAEMFLTSLIFTVVTLSSWTLVSSQIVLLPDEHVADPFKDNPKWEKFKLEQRERLDELKVLVDNVYNLLEEVEKPSPDYDFKGTFVKFQFQSFADFFQETELKLHTQNVYPTFNAAVGKKNITALYTATKEADSNSKSKPEDLNKLRLKWIELHGMAHTMHAIYRQVTSKIFSTEPEKTSEIFEPAQSEHEIWTAVAVKGSENGNGSTKSVTVKDLVDSIDSEIVAAGENHVLRRLVRLLQHMEQHNVDVDERLNYFCYANNWFGVLPDLIDIVSNTALYLTTVDMKKLVLDLFQQTYSAFYGGVSKDNFIAQRQQAWDELVKRVDHKVNFTYLDGTGWKYADGPVIFKWANLPPPTGHEWYRQWGRNITTGARPNASHILENNPQAGPYKPDDTLGYYDDRTPEMNYVAFQQTYQGYIEAEMVLNPRGNCVGTCEDYQDCNNHLCADDRCPMLKNHHCPSSDPDCLRKNCKFAKNCVRAAQTVQMCSSNETGKIYDWVSLNGKVMARQNVTVNEKCDDPNSKLFTAVERWDMESGVIMAAPVYCELCLCTCLEPANEDEQDYFDLQEALADVANGYIISSMKFVKEGHVIRLAVEQGMPLVNGKIDELSVKWVEPSPFDMKNPNKTSPLGTRGFTKLNFNLVAGEPGTVLTGIRFMVDESLALTLEVQVTPIKWTDDQKPLSPASLMKAESVWVARGPGNLTREPLDFQKPLNNPSQQQGPSMPDVVMNSFVEFTTTSYETDLAQSIVPFFDAQAVHYYEGKTWLRGAGIMHKGRSGSTGFITPMIIAAKPNEIVRYTPKTEE